MQLKKEKVKVTFEFGRWVVGINELKTVSRFFFTSWEEVKRFCKKNNLKPELEEGTEKRKGKKK